MKTGVTFGTSEFFIMCQNTVRSALGTGGSIRFCPWLVCPQLLTGKVHSGTYRTSFL